MARTTGGDVIVQLMHEVAQLKATSSDYARRFEALDERFEDLADRMFEISGQVHALAVQTRKRDEGIKRIASLVARLAAETDAGFDQTERRLDAAEEAVRALSRRA